jgi:hypothetical protein
MLLSTGLFCFLGAVDDAAAAPPAAEGAAAVGEESKAAFEF